MKKLFLPSLLLLFSSGLIFSQHQDFSWKPFVEQTIPDPKVSELGNFPVLVIDSSHCEIYSQTPPYSLFQTVIESYQYDNLERRVKEIRLLEIPSFFVSNLTHTTYTYDAQGRVIATLTLKDNDGRLENADKTETTFSPDGLSAESIGFYWNGSDWVFSTRTIQEYDQEGRIPLQTFQIWNGSAWDNNSRNIREWDANGNATLYRSEQWDNINGDWFIAFQQILVYDATGKLFSVTAESGTADALPIPTAKSEYYYDTEGRNDSVFYFSWDEMQSQWNATSVEANTFNAQDELVETLTYSIVNQVPLISRRSLLTYGDKVYSALPEERLNQIWDQGEFKDQQLYNNTFTDLPNGKVLNAYDTKTQIPPGSGDWILNVDCNNLYHISTISSTGQPSQEINCSVPNPYSAGMQVVCSDLKENQSYMLWVYGLDGRLNYARQFTGAEGWSIGQQLPEGMYVAVVTCNGNRMFARRIVFK